MNKPETGKLKPGELRAESPGAKVPTTAAGAPKPAAEKPTAAQTPKTPASAQRPDTRPGAAKPADPARTAAVAVPSQRIHPGARFIARFAHEVLAPDIAWTGKWAVALRGCTEQELIDQYRANQEALTEAAKSEEDLHKHLKNLHDIRRQLPAALKVVDELLKELPLEAFAGQRIASKALAKQRRDELEELLAELEEKEEGARGFILDKMTHATDADSLRTALQHASDEVALLGIDYPMLLDGATDLKAELRTIRRHHEKAQAKNAA